ncbi:MAG: amidohydrolase family protein [Gemmatimonadales bacterium]
MPIDLNLLARRWPALLAVAALLSTRSPAALAQGPVAVVDVAVIDPIRGTVTPGQTVVMDGDTIVAVGPSRSTPVPRGARSVPGTGRFLIPGLWDLHTHVSMAGRGSLAALLANGVTGIRDMGGDPVVLAWRDSVRAGRLTGPRIRSAGLIVESARWLTAVIDLTRPLGRPDLLADLERRLSVGTPEDAERAVDSLRRIGADFVKIRNYPSPSAYFALVRAARRHGLGIQGHAPPLGFVRQISDSGFVSLEHAILEFRDGALHEGLSGMEPASRRELLGALARNGTAVVPTLGSGRARLVPDSVVERMIADTGGRTDPRLRSLPRGLREEWRSQLALKRADPSPDVDWAGIHRASAAMVGDMIRAGVTIGAGTDLGIPTLIPGFSLADELEALVDEAHLTPTQALQTATANAAHIAGLGERSGLLAPRRVADAVLLDANPLEDIRAVRRIVAVIAAGRLYTRSELDRLLLDAGK